MKRTRQTKPKRIRLSGFFLRRLLPCLLAAAVINGALLYRDYHKEAENWNFGSDEWESRLSQILTENFDGNKTFGETLLEEGGEQELLQYLTRHTYPFLESDVPIPGSDISVMLIQPETGEMTVSEPGVTLYTFTNKPSANDPNHPNRRKAESHLYEAAPEEAEQIADDMLAYAKKHILRIEWIYRAANNGAAFGYTEPTALRAAVKDDRFTLLDSGWLDGLTVKNQVCRDEELPDGWRILTKNGFIKQNGKYVYDANTYTFDTVPAGEETISTYRITGYPANCKAGKLMRMTADTVNGYMHAELERCDELKEIIADSSGTLREKYYSEIYTEALEKRKRYEEAEKLGITNFFTPTDNLPTPEEKLKERLDTIGFMPQDYAWQITSGNRTEPENKWTQYYWQTTPVTLNGTNYFLFCLMTRDLRLALFPDFVFRSMQCLLAALLFAILWTILVYPKTRRKYEMDEYRRSLTAALAHDLKSPLTAISGYAENLSSGVHPEKQAHYSASILENTQYMDRIITNVLELSKLEQNTRTKKKWIDLIALMREAAEYRQDDADAHELGISISGECTVYADPLMMAQAMRNLLDNAVKYTPDGGSITVTGNDRTLRITNDIAADKIAHTETLSEAFVKGDSARSSRSGTGLGLSVVRQAAALNKLRFRIESGEHKFTVQICDKPLLFRRMHF